ncbi:MAG: SDR family NAD(P)-dependent oxidoreductase, partial [Candidatus Pacebacteria bacterium]|nr:SDR family NAD(P)-dependent oxidoreductase [Candidatus Paceibacterota bacterium]
MNNYLESLFQLKNKIVVVTGAAGQLGAEFVRGFLKAGAKVAAFDINLKNPKGSLKNIQSKDLILVKVDITHKDSLKKGLARVISCFGDPDVLVNNAALDTPPNTSKFNTGSFETYPEELWDTMIKVNLKGMF